MSSTTRSRILATGLACGLVLAPAAGARPAAPDRSQAPATTMRDAAGSPVGTAPQGSSHQAAPAETRAPVVVRTVDDGLDVGSLALGAGGAALVLLVSAAGVTAVRRGGLRHGLS